MDVNSGHYLFLWAVVAILTQSVPPEAASAVSETRYAQMLRESQDLRDADQELRDVMTHARTTLTPEDFKKIQALQKQWETGEREANIAEYVNSGLPLSEAWALELGSRADYLTEQSERLRFKHAARGIEGVYEYARNGSGRHHGGSMQIRREDDVYLVTMEITRGSEKGLEICTWSGEGRLRGNILQANVEDDPTALVRITFKGETATVSATPAANAECGSDIRLGGVYIK